jgi:DNA polymerase-3 subunit delta'
MPGAEWSTSRMSVDLDVWGDVVGQARAEADLRAAVQAPLHAYLFVGPPGSGRMAAARAFAAALFSRDAEGGEAERHARLALEGKHPDLIVFEPEGARLSVDMDKGDLPVILQEVNRSPVEADRKLVVLGQFHTMEQFAGAFLKTIEEPPPRTIIVVVADEIPPELVTTASRCVRIDFGRVPDAAVAERLVAEGVTPDRAREAADAASGDLGRARLLATDPDLAARRDAWRAVPDRLDGTGARVVDLVEDLRGRIDAAQAPLDAQHAEEQAALEEQIERYGLRRGLLTELATRHKRQVRTLRRQEIIFGLANLAGRYRDALAEGRDPADLVDGLAAIQTAAEDLVRNPLEELQLLGLFLKLPRLR